MEQKITDKILSHETENFTMQIIRKDPYTITSKDKFLINWKYSLSADEMKTAQKDLNKIMDIYNKRLI